MAAVIETTTLIEAAARSRKLVASLADSLKLRNAACPHCARRAAGLKSPDSSTSPCSPLGLAQQLDSPSAQGGANVESLGSSLEAENLNVQDEIEDGGIAREAAMHQMRSPSQISLQAAAEMAAESGNAQSEGGQADRGPTMVFVYGTLKRGFFNHTLVQDQMKRGGVVFLGTARSVAAYPLVIPGPFHVPFLLNMPNRGQRVWGELYVVDREALAALDLKEGVHYGYYTRAPIRVTDFQPNTPDGHFIANVVCTCSIIDAGVYFEAGTHTRRLAELPHLEEYTAEEAQCYLPRAKRPLGVCFTGSIGQWLDKLDQTESYA